MNINFASYVVRFIDGSIDHDATVDKFSGDLLRFEAERETEMAVISQAVHALFDQFKGVRMNTPYVTGEVLRRLNVQPENYKTLHDKVVDFIRSSSQGKTLDDGSVECPNSVFVIGKGKGGGIARRADLPTKG
jgi:hypothetical protein